MTQVLTLSPSDSPKYHQHSIHIHSRSSSRASSIIDDLLRLPLAGSHHAPIDQDMSAAVAPASYQPVASTSALPEAAFDRVTAAGDTFKIPGTNGGHRNPNASPQTEANLFVDGKGKQVDQGRPVYVNLPNHIPRSYTILKEVGDGSFGTVWLADWHSPLELPPGTTPPGPSSRPEYAGKRLVAIKRMKKAFAGGWDECMKLKELKSLRTITSHPHIIPLYDAFLQPESKELYFVFECMEGNLYQLTKSRKGRPLAGGLTASIFQQILLGLHHIHQSGFFHRDMKPENLLITTTGLADYPPSALYALPGSPYEKDVVCTVKLADFGLARETNSRPPYTEYVSTRWYRAPEVLLRSRDYSNPVDMWALGTILTEMVNLKPLFPGQSEIDQVVRICEILGDPTTDYGRDAQGRPRGGGTWEKGMKMAKTVGFQWPKHNPVNFASLFDHKTVSPQFIDCVMGLLRYEPTSRYTTSDCLYHPYFREIAPLMQPVQAVQARQVLPPTPTSGQSIHQQSLHLPQPPMPVSPPQSGRSQNSPADLHRAMWQAARHVSMANSVQSMPESVASNSAENYSPVPWQRLSNPQINLNTFRQSTAASSDYYDGSIFEGIAPTREVSLYNFQNGMQSGGSSMFTPSVYNQPLPQDPNIAPVTVYDNQQIYDSAMRDQRLRQEQQYRETLQQQQMQAASKGKGWSFGSVFGQEGKNIPQVAPATSSSLKRTTSQRSAHQIEPSPALPSENLDPKKAKKEAERAAKQAEKVRREAAALAARERARAVLQKKAQLERKADPMSIGPDDASGKSDAQRSLKPGRATDGGRSPALPKISEHSIAPTPAILQSDFLAANYRAKARRRDDDDDVHSVSSNETRNSGERRFTSQSYSAMDTDAAQMRQYAWQQQIGSATRISTGSSFGSNNSRPGPLDHLQMSQSSWDRPPPSSGSSVDLHLAQGFQGLSATDGSHAAFSMSTASAPGLESTAPAIHSLAYRQHNRHVSNAASYHSMPTSMYGGPYHSTPLGALQTSDQQQTPRLDASMSEQNTAASLSTSPNYNLPIALFGLLATSESSSNGALLDNFVKLLAASGVLDVLWLLYCSRIDLVRAISLTSCKGRHSYTSLNGLLIVANLALKPVIFLAGQTGRIQSSFGDAAQSNQTIWSSNAPGGLPHHDNTAAAPTNSYQGGYKFADEEDEEDLATGTTPKAGNVPGQSGSNSYQSV